MRVSGGYRFVQSKYPDHPHWDYPATLLGHDRHGLWCHVPAGTMAQRGHEAPRAVETGFVALVPEDGCWIAEFYSLHPRHSVYVNIGTRPRVGMRKISQIDLDLDVVRTVAGEVKVLDEEEFARNRLLYGYPAELVDLARATTDTVTSMLRDNHEPFGNAADVWLGSITRSPEW